MRRNLPEVIADFEAYLLRLTSSAPLMRLAACGGCSALPHAFRVGSNILLPPKKHAVRLEERTGIACKETHFSLLPAPASVQQVSSCPFFLLPSFRGVDKVGFESLLAGTFIWGLGEKLIQRPLGSPAFFFRFPQCVKRL